MTARPASMPVEPFERGQRTHLPRIWLVFGCLALSLPLAVYALAGSNMRYTGDDYCYGGFFRQQGFWGALHSSYRGPAPFHGNRYSLTVVSGIAELGGAAANAALPALAISLWLVALLLLIGQVTRRFSLGLQGIAGLLAAELLVFSSLAISPELEQSLYWRSGSLPYLAPLILMSFLAAALLAYAGRERTSLPRLLPLLLLALISGGFSETAAALQFGALLLSLAAFLKLDSSVFPSGLQAIGAALAGTVTALLIMLASPANAYRLADLTVTSDVRDLAAMSLRHAYIYLHGLPVWHPVPGLAVFVAFFGLTVQGELELGGAGHGGARWTQSLVRSVLLAAAWCALILASMIPSAYAQSSYPVGRALVGAAFVSVLGTAGFGILAGRLVRAHASNLSRLRIPLLLLFLAAVTPYPLVEASAELSELPRYRRWSQFWDSRDRQVREARSRGIQELEVVLLDTIIPEVAELQPDPDFWYNNCAEWLYDVGRLSANQPGWDG